MTVKYCAISAKRINVHFFVKCDNPRINKYLKLFSSDKVVQCFKIAFKITFFKPFPMQSTWNKIVFVISYGTECRTCCAKLLNYLNKKPY